MSKLVINGDDYEVAESELTGVQVRALAALDPDLEIIVEGRGSEPDRPLGDDDKIVVGGAVVRAFTRPMTSFGEAGG